MENRTCQNCKHNFVIEADDFSFYEKMQVPPPTFCTECRFKRRLVWRNERSLYKRPCDLCKKDKIMMYPKDAPFPVYCKECWASDGWNPTEYGRDYDFGKPFFSQMHSLMLSVPRPGTIQQGDSVNSDYSNRAANIRNCYLVFDSTGSENSLYSNRINLSKEVMDCLTVTSSEQCYESIDCTKCSRCFWSQEAQECANSYFLFNCRNCTDSFGCVNLRNKSHCIFNEQYSPEEYKKFISEFLAGGREAVAEMQAKMRDFSLQFPRQYYFGRNNQEFSGNWLENCKNAKHCFTCTDGWNLKYCSFLLGGPKDSMDYTSWGWTSELVYESINCGIGCKNLRFCHESWMGAFDLTYCMNCPGSNNLLGCIGIKSGSYMIFNKQLTKAEYEELAPKIIEQAKSLPYVSSNGMSYTFGEFYPIELAPFCYNESVSQEYFPITEAEATEKKFPWKTPEEKHYQATITNSTLPADIMSVPDTFISEVIACEGGGNIDTRCTSAFRITADELAFYKRFNLPLPAFCYNCRYYSRLEKRAPLRLWKRECMCTQETHGHDGICPNEFETSYSSEQSDLIYCEKCYQAEVV